MVRADVSISGAAWSAEIETQTAQEFVRVIADAQLRRPVGRFTDAYESARFGNSADDAMRLPELYEEVELATKK